MPLKSMPPTNSVDVLSISGGVALKIGNGYLTIASDGKLRVSGAVPADEEDGTVVGTQT